MYKPKPAHKGLPSKEDRIFYGFFTKNKTIKKLVAVGNNCCILVYTFSQVELYILTTWQLLTSNVFVEQ